MTAKPKPIIKTGDIQAAMAKKWVAPEYAIMWEVGEGTGAMGGRYADAVIMSLWPSRGLELHGIEIKVTRADWKREAADPTKAEAIAKYCHRWYIHTPPGVVQDLSELPPAWGLREWDGRCWRTIREAGLRVPEPITYRFLAAMMRRADNAMARMVQEAAESAREAAQQAIQKEEETYARRVEAAVERRTRSLSAREAELDAFNKAFGNDPETLYNHRDPEAWGRAAKALAQVANGYTPLVERLRKAANEIEILHKLSQGEPDDQPAD